MLAEKRQKKSPKGKNSTEPNGTTNHSPHQLVDICCETETMEEKTNAANA